MLATRFCIGALVVIGSSCASHSASSAAAPASAGSAAKRVVRDPLVITQEELQN